MMVGIFVSHSTFYFRVSALLGSFLTHLQNDLNQEHSKGPKYLPLDQLEANPMGSAWPVV
jgi:hypothetical protein